MTPPVHRTETTEPSAPASGLIALARLLARVAAAEGHCLASPASDDGAVLPTHSPSKEEHDDVW
jgi:hypothetical protein